MNEEAKLILNRLDEHKEHLKEIQTENRHDHTMFQSTMVEHSNRITAVETSLSKLEPRVDENQRKANSIKQKVVKLDVAKAQKNGEEKGKSKIMRYVWPVALIMISGLLGGVGWILKGWIDG